MQQNVWKVATNAAAQVFKSRIGSLRKGLKSRVEFVFMDAPYSVEAADVDELQENGGGEQGRSWWVLAPLLARFTS